jgi:WD40 repeat protein/serine/threonine protein kinase
MSNSSSTSDALAATLGRIIEDAVTAAESGRPLAVDELVEQHPDLADQLRELWPAAEMLLRIGYSQGSATAHSPTHQSTELTGQPLGDFRLIREIGRGGMGVVYEAEQLSLGRRVAVKVLPLASMLDKQHLARFQNEARAVATLSHSHIVPVYAVGCERGVHFYAMQLIEGRSLAQVIEEVRARDLQRQVSSFQVELKTDGDGETQIAATSTVPDCDTQAYFRTAARLIAEAAEALDHAHNRGILHRDVKPANLLLDETGKLWVADFGLAQLGGHSDLTLTGDLVGTLRYMSPEQALGKRAAVDVRADVYSLGATLFELVTLEPVYSDADREQLLAKIALDEPRAARQINPHVPTDLETIAGKALQRDPADRYLTAGDLADDLRRYLAEQPIRARPATDVDRIVKYFRRRPAVAASIGAALLVICVTLLVATVLINRARQDALLALDRTSELLYTADMTTACQALEKNRADEVRLILDKYRPRGGERDRRGYEWYLLAMQAPPLESQALLGHTGAVNELTVLPDGRSLASVGDDGTLRIWDSQTGSCRRLIRLSAEPLNAVAASPDGKYIAAGGIGSTVFLYDLQKRFAARSLHKGAYSVESLAFSGDSTRLAAGYRYEEVCLLNLTGEVIARVPSRARLKTLEHVPETDSWRFPNQPAHGSGKHDHVIEQWSGDLATLEREFKPDGTGGGKLRFGKTSRSGQYLIGADEQGRQAILLDLTSGREIGRTPRARDHLFSLAVSPNGQCVALGYSNGIVECFPVARDPDGMPQLSMRPQVFRVGEGDVIDLVFVDDATLATAGADGRVGVWRVGAHWPIVKQPDQRHLIGMGLSPRGDALLCWYRKKVFILEPKSGRVVSQLPVDGANSDEPMAAWSPTGARVAAWSPGSAGPVLIYDRHGRHMTSMESSSEVVHAAISPDDKVLATVGEHLQLTNIDTGEQIFQSPLPSEAPSGWRVAFSHDGRYLAYGGNEPTLVIMNVTTRQRRWEITAEEDVDCLAFSPDDSTLATGHGDSLIRIWDLDEGRLRTKLAGHAGAVRHVAFAPDGDRLLSASVDGTTRIWSAGQGHLFGILPLTRHALDVAVANSAASRISLSTDGRRLAVCGVDSNGRSELAVFDVNLGPNEERTLLLSAADR